MSGVWEPERSGNALFEDPKRTEAEQAVLGSILIDSRCLPKVVGIVKPEYFEGVNQFLFRVILERFSGPDGVNAVDPVQVLEASRRAGCPMEHARLRQYVMDLMEITPTAANAERYAHIVRERAHVAMIHRTAQELADIEDLPTLRQKLTEASESAMDRRAARTKSMAQLMADFFDDYESPRRSLPWPFKPLNERLFAERGDYILLGAESSVGKTALALQLATFWARKGLKVDFFSLETGDRDIRNRIIAGFLGIDMQRILKRQLSDLELAQAAHISSAASTLPFGLVDACDMTVEDISARAMTDGVDIAIIDYLQLIPPSGRAWSREREVGDISLSLKRFGRRAGVTVVVLAQLNSDNFDAEPSLDRIRESKQPRMDADLGFLLFLKSKNAAEGDPDFGKRILKVDKNKRGPRARITLNFDGPQQLFYTSKSQGPTPLFRLPQLEQMGMGI